jgi:GxxExxY protein
VKLFRKNLFTAEYAENAEDRRMNPNEITHDIIAAAMKVHSALGPGLLESAYEVCLAFELARMGHKVDRQVELPVVYEGVKLDAGYRMDLLVDDCVVVEVKAVETILPVFEAQLLSYLRLSGKQVGLLINFHVTQLKQGIRRLVNRLDSSADSAYSAVNRF